MRLKNIIIIIAVLMWLVWVGRVEGSVLSTAADSMPPDSWAVLSTNGISTSTLLESASATGMITGDVSRGCWDPVGQKMHFIGQGHSGIPTAGPLRHVVYDAATNTWSRLTDVPWNPQGSNSIEHNWNYQGCDSRGRVIYRGAQSVLTVRKYDIGSATWSTVAAVPSNVQSYPGFNGFTFHQGRGGYGRLIVTGLENCPDQGALTEYDPNTNTWARITPGLLSGYSPGGNCSGTPYSFAEYSDVTKVAMFGGGATTRLVDARGTLTTTSAIPCEANENRHGLIHADPATGNFVLLCGDNPGSWYVYNVASNTWNAKPATNTISAHIGNFPNTQLTAQTWGVFGTPIWDHGVIMYVKCNASACQVSLYKGGPFGAADRDFKQRAHAPGVINAWGFDSTNDTSGSTLAGVAHIDPGSSGVPPTLDGATKASGNSALKMTIASQSGANGAGSWSDNFRDNLSRTVGSGGEFYVQWRQRFSSSFLSTNYVSTGNNGWKQMSMSEGDRAGTPVYSCVDIDIPVQNTQMRGIAQMYHSCGVKDGKYEPLDVETGGFIYPQYGPTLNCKYPGPYSEPQCFRYKADQWMTFQARVKVGTWYSNNGVYSHDSIVQMWEAAEGQPSVLVMDRSPGSGTGYDLVNLNPSVSKYGKIWLLPYHTGKDSTQVTPSANVWYDEVIVSTSRINDPGVPSAPGDTTPPTVAVTAPGNGATVSGSVNVTASASDNVGVIGVQFKLNGTNLGAEDTSSPYAVSWDTTTSGNGTYVLTAVARDAASNTTTSTAVSVTVNNVSAPPVISGVSAQGITSTGATIVWTTSTASDSQVDYGTTISYGSSTTLNTSLVTSHSQALSGLSTGVLYHYRVKSTDAQARQTVSGDFTFTTLDSTAPSVSITAPSNSATVSGIVSVTANASDNVAVVGVQFKRDGVNIGAEDTSSPYAVSWDTSGVSDGPHTLTAVARDAAGNSTISSTINVTVSNGAEIFFVTKSGNDSNTCTQAKTQGTAKLTIAGGLSCMGGGDTLRIGDGTYTESISLSGGTLSGTSTTRTSIQALTINGSAPGVILAPASGTSVISVVDTSYLSVKGIDVNAANVSGNGVQFTGTSTNDVLEDSHVRAGGAGIIGVLVSSDSNTIRRATVHDIGSTNTHIGIRLLGNSNLVEDSNLYLVAGHAIQAYANGSTTSSNVIRRNKVHGSVIARGGIALDADAGSTTANQVYNNLVYANSTGILLFGTGSGNKIWNNTVYANTQYGININAGQANAEIANNIVYLNGSGIQNSGSGTIQNNNITSDPMFTAAGSEDFTLTSGSIARDTGTTLTAFTTDYAQITRPVGSAWDVGAYEYVSGADTTPPTVSITSPLNGATVSGASVSIAANAVDNVGVAGVQFRVDSASFGSEDTSAPYAVSWDTTALSNGSHTLGCIARDTAGNTSSCADVVVTVNNSPAPDTTPPVVAITAPASGSTVSGASVLVSANATDNTGVVGVQFKLDGVNLQAEDTTSPYSIVWNTTAGVGNGAHTLTAVARDAAANSTTSNPVTITVNNVVPDTQPPTVSVTSPTNGSTLIGTVTLTASASDDVGVVGVRFIVDGADFGGEDISAPFALDWNTAGVVDGSHTVSARARDAAGNSTTATSVSVTTSNTAPVITNVSAGSITTSGATITWSTAIASTSRVEYGTTTAYGSTSALDNTLVTSHSVALTGLSAFTLYHYRVASTNSAGQTGTSGDFTFATLAGGTSSITVTEPTSSTVWVYKSIIPINWTSANVTGNVKIELSRNGGNTWKTIITSTPNDGTVNFRVTQPSSNSCVLRIRSLVDTSVVGFSDGLFRIVTKAP